MNLGIPTSAYGDVASTTSSFISQISTVAALAIGIYVAFFVLQFLITTLANRWYPMDERESE